MIGAQRSRLGGGSEIDRLKSFEAAGNSMARPRKVKDGAASDFPGFTPTPDIRQQERNVEIPRASRCAMRIAAKSPKYEIAEIPKTYPPHMTRVEKKRYNGKRSHRAEHPGFRDKAEPIPSFRGA